MHKNKFLNQHDGNSSEFIEPSLDIKKFSGKILEKWLVIISSIIVAVIIAFFVSRYTTPSYSATALLIKEPKSSNNSVQDLLYGNDFINKNYSNIENEIVVLKSKNLVEKTLEKLNFNISYFKKGSIRDDELYNDSPINIILNNDITNQIPYEASFKCKIVDKTTFILLEQTEDLISSIDFSFEQEERMEYPFMNKELYFNENYDIGGFKFQVRLDTLQYRSNPNKEILFKINSYNSLVRTFQNKLELSPYSPESSVIKISMSGNHRQKILDYLNTHMENFISGELERKNDNALKTIDFIDRQIAEMSDSLDLIEDKLEFLKKSNTSLNVSNEGGELYTKSKEVEIERSARIMDSKYLKDLEWSLKNDDLDNVVVPSFLGINDPSLNRAVQQLVDLQMEIKIIQSDRNLNNPLARIKKQQVTSLKNNIFDIVQGLLKANQLQLNNLNNRLGNLNSSIQNLPTAERKYVNIQRMHDLSENLYLFLMQKKTEAGIAKTANTIDYRIVEHAKLDSPGPIKPKPFLNMAIAVLLGFFVPVSVIYLREITNNKVRTKEELQNLSSIPLLGMIARNDDSVYNLATTNPMSDIAESFRTIRSNLRYMMKSNDSECKLLLITSSISGEGKTFCGINLAYFFSNFGKKVLFLNADMRKSNKNYLFHDDKKEGLSDYLSGNCETIDKLVYGTDYKGLSILPSGAIPPNPSELLLNGKIEFLLNELKKDFDYIIIDTPPVGIISDGYEFMDKVDVNIFIVRQNYSLKDQIREIDDHYLKNSFRNPALIFNDVNFKKLNYGYSYYKQYQQIGTRAANPWWKKLKPI